MASCTPLVNKLAFFPTKTPLDEKQPLPEGVREVYITTADRERLQSFYIANDTATKLLVYFSGNGGNLYPRLPELMRIAQTGVAVLGVGYRGYGKSSGSPSEKGIYRDAEAGVRYAVDSLKFSYDRMIICGRSIGTTAAVHVGSLRSYAGVLLVTPVTSGKEYARALGFGPLAIIAGSSFNNEETCTRIVSPVLVIHGTADEVLPFRMGKRIFDKIKSPKEFIAIDGGLHNTLEFKDPDGYWGAITRFVADHGNGSRERVARSYL
jgi:fermentation-respiration switch protein FrsA (DUF1100 family)